MALFILQRINCSNNFINFLNLFLINITQNRVIDAKAKYLKVSKKSIEKDFVSMASMNSWIEEEDIGKLCSFLASDDSHKISGQSIAVDGNTLRAD